MQTPATILQKKCVGPKAEKVISIFILTAGGKSIADTSVPPNDYPPSET